MGSVRAVLKRDSNVLWALLVEVAKVIPLLLQRQVEYGDVMPIRDCCCVLSGVVEPLGAVLTILISQRIIPLLPYLPTLTEHPSPYIDPGYSR